MPRTSNKEKELEVKNDVLSETNESVESVTGINTVVAKAKEINRLSNEMLVPVMNNTNANLYFAHRNCIHTLDMMNYGDIEEITLGELMTMKASHPRFLNECWLLILNEDIVKYMGLTRLYENVIPPDKIEKFFELSVEKIEEILTKSPVQVKENIGKVVMAKVKGNEWRDYQKLKVIEKVLKVKFE